MKLNINLRWLIRLLFLFPALGAVTGIAFCGIIQSEMSYGAIFGAIYGIVFGSMIAWPSINISFWRIGVCTAIGTILFGSAGVWLWDGLIFIALFLAPLGFWAGYLVLYLYVVRTKGQETFRSI